MFDESNLLTNRPKVAFKFGLNNRSGKGQIHNGQKIPQSYQSMKIEMPLRVRIGSLVTKLVGTRSSGGCAKRYVFNAERRYLDTSN